MDNPSFISFLKQSKPFLYRRRERIILPDQEIDNIFYITQGYVMQSILSPNGNQFTPYIFSPNSFFPLVLGDEEAADIYGYEYESLTPVEVYKLSKGKLSTHLKENPQAASFMSKQLRNYSAYLLKKLETRVFSDALHMVILGLLDLAKLFDTKKGKQVTINYWFTHQDIANISGLSREVVTIQMNKLIKKKLISYSSHFIVINNLTLLEEELQKER